MSSSRILFPTRITPRQRLLNPCHPCPSSWRRSPSPSPSGPSHSPCCSPAQSRSTSSKSSSSSQWLSRQKRDPFVRSRTNTLLESSSSSPSQSYVARSAFKLLELHQSSLGGGRRPLIRKGMTIVDLGASPGGWIQACRTLVATDTSQVGGRASGSAPSGAHRSGARTRIIGLDLLPLDRSLDDQVDLDFLQGDFLDPYIQAQLSDLLGTRDQAHAHVDLVLSDMLNNQSGSPLRDSQRSIDLCRSALEFASKHLRVERSKALGEGEGDGELLGEETTSNSPSIQLVMKCLQSDLAVELGNELRRSFKTVRWEKPKSSRAESREGYWVCAGFKGDGGDGVEPGAGKGRSGKGKARAGKGDEEAGEGDGLYF